MIPRIAKALGLQPADLFRTSAASKTHVIAAMSYDREAAGALRDEAIAIRDAALKANEMNTTIVQSHVVAFMAVAIKEMYGPD
jgi:hypothetical protein